MHGSTVASAMVARFVVGTVNVTNSVYCSMRCLCAAVYCDREELEEADILWMWPRTASDGLASLQCPCEARPELTEGVRAVRFCLPTGEWGSPNVKTCFSEVQRLLCNVRTQQLSLEAHLYLYPVVLQNSEYT